MVNQCKVINELAKYSKTYVMWHFFHDEYCFVVRNVPFDLSGEPNCVLAVFPTYEEGRNRSGFVRAANEARRFYDKYVKSRSI